MEKKITKAIKLLTDYMEKYGYNQKDVAIKLGVNESTVSRWFKGQGVTWKHINAIQFLTSGHLDNFSCKLTGLPTCPFDDNASPHLKTIIERAQMLSSVNQSKVNTFIEELIEEQEGKQSPVEMASAG